MREKRYRDLRGLPKPQQALWVHVLLGKLVIRDIRKILCWNVHEDVRLNLREYLLRYLLKKIHTASQQALNLALWQVVGDSIAVFATWDQDLRLSCVSEFTYRVPPSNFFVCPYPYPDGSVAPKETQEDIERHTSDFVCPPSDLDMYTPSLHPSF